MESKKYYQIICISVLIALLFIGCVFFMCKTSYLEGKILGNGNNNILLPQRYSSDGISKSKENNSAYLISFLISLLISSFVAVATYIFTKVKIKSFKKDENHSLKQVNVNESNLLYGNGFISVKQILGFAGATIFLIGIFMPFISIPIIGSMDLYRIGQIGIKGGGIYIVLLAASSFVLCLFKLNMGLWITGFIKLAFILYIWISYLTIDVKSDIPEIKNGMAAAVSRAMQIHLQWGTVILMLVGIGLIIGSGAWSAYVSQIKNAER